MYKCMKYIYVHQNVVLVVHRQFYWLKSIQKIDWQVGSYSRVNKETQGKTSLALGTFPLWEFLWNTGRNIIGNVPLTWALLMVAFPLAVRTPRQRHEFWSPKISSFVHGSGKLLATKFVTKKSARKEVNIDGAEAVRHVPGSRGRGHAGGCYELEEKGCLQGYCSSSPRFHIAFCFRFK